jgi:ketosteroid isomerase-like protein
MQLTRFAEQRRFGIAQALIANGLPALLALLAVTSLAFCRPSFAADLAAAEAAVRKADADWAAVARTVSVDAWIAFYAADAVVLLPNNQLASDNELVRHSVSRLLALPDLRVVWSPIKVEVARSGERALLIETFELRFGDSRGSPVSDRGRRLEIWSKQADGIWKCVVDTWNLDEPVAATSTAPLASAPGALPTVGSAAPPAQQAPPPPATVLDAGPPKPVPVVATKYGAMPTNYEDAIRKCLPKHLKYPDSIQYREITTPEQGYTSAVTGTILMRETRTYGWTVKATINAKNSRDSYVGFNTYTFLFRDEKIVDVRLPLPGDEMCEPMPGDQGSCRSSLAR